MKPSVLILTALLSVVLGEGSDHLVISTPNETLLESQQSENDLPEDHIPKKTQESAAESILKVGTNEFSNGLSYGVLEEQLTELLENDRSEVPSSATVSIPSNLSTILAEGGSNDSYSDFSDISSVITTQISNVSKSFSGSTSCTISGEGAIVPTLSDELDFTSSQVNTTYFDISAIPPEDHNYETSTTSILEKTTKNNKASATDVIEVPSEANLTVNSTLLSFQNSSNRTDQEDDLESHFMSFEEWKKQKVGNDLPPARKLKAQGAKIPAKQINQNINAAIGEDMEIDLGMFSGALEEDEGGKLYKDRFNYASFDCAATIVKTNSEAKGASSILNENKDSYLLNECKAQNKFVTIELCQDILVDTVLIGNYEFFSSTFKKFRLSVSDRFPVPVNGWTILGEFEAENIRALQTFSVKNPLIWARYLRLEVLSYYGNEYYCPISVIRVHGQTMIDEFKNEEGQALEQENSKSDSPVTVEVTSNNTHDEFQNETIFKDNKTLSNFEAAVVDAERINTLNEECSVVLPHLGIEQFLEELYSTENDFCSEEETVTKPAPIETKEPTTQESIYKNIVKRLSLLESNASLSLLYIEEQSKLLSNAFTKLEKRQTSKFDLLVSAFNESIHSQLSQMKNLYTNLHQETALILTSQRRTHRDLVLESTRKVILLSSELTFFKRLTTLNTIFIICLLAYVVATRETYIETEYIEDEDGSWYDFNNSQPGSPATIDSPTDSLLHIEKLSKKKKKIKFSVSHKLSSGVVAPLNTGNFYFEPSHSHGSSFDENSIRHINSGASSFDSNSFKSGNGMFAEGREDVNRDAEKSDDESVELNVNQ